MRRLARGRSGAGQQIVRDWVLRFNAEGPGDLLNRKAPGAPGTAATGARRCGKS